MIVTDAAMTRSPLDCAWSRSQCTIFILFMRQNEAYANSRSAMSKLSWQMKDLDFFMAVSSTMSSR